MIKNIIQKIKFTNILYILMGTILLALGAVLSPINHYITGLILCVGAVAIYFYVVIYVSEKNWFDIRAVFAGAWIFTIGLASLCLLDYQEPWKTATWLYNALAYMMFQIGTLGGPYLCDGVYKRVSKIKCKHCKVELRENRLFGICVVVTLIGILCFTANAYVRGYIPFFSSDPSAYVTFHTKFNLFAMAATMISGLCYYCIKTQKIAVWKKGILVLCIAYATFLYPTLVISRGVFLASALSLVTAIFYLNRKKLWVLICSLVFVVGVYLLLSNARGYTDAQLDVFFEPSQIEIEEPDSDTSEGEVFVLPSKVAFVYSYLTVSHDNFNEAVQNAKEYTYGLRQLAPINLKPINMILDLSAVEEATNGEYYLVRPHLNTVNLIGNFYYDLRGFGIAFFMLMWGCIFAAIQAYYIKKEGPFALLALGNVMTPVALCFFSPWMNLLQFWVLWGTGWILWGVACLHFVKKQPK